MKKKILILIIFFPIFFCAQNEEKKFIFQFKNAKTDQQKIIFSLKLAEFYLESDAEDNCQKYINEAKKYNLKLNSEEFNSIIHSLQTELFYYLGLFDFGIYESKKQLKNAINLKDSLLISDAYFFTGLHYFELKKFQNSEMYLLESLRYFPNSYKPNKYHNLINKEHIFNNLAQVYIHLDNLKNAKKMNRVAYLLALMNNSKRGIPNTENTFGKIYLKENKKDSAQIMFKKSIENALRYDYYDLQLLNISGLIEANKLNENSLNYYKQAQILVNTKPINNNFKEQFYQNILPIFKETKNVLVTNIIQEEIISLDQIISKEGNKHLQNITSNYLKSEQDALKFKNKAIQKQNKMLKIQFAIICVTLFLLLLIFYLVFKSKYQTQKKLLYQKNEINASLHDDIGSDLSSIYFNSQILLQNLKNEALSKKLTQKIKDNSQEVSQKLKTFIWALDDSKDTLYNFVDYVKNYSHNYFENNAIKIHFSEKIENGETKIDGFTRKHLFLIIKECLNNILKHAKATESFISISFSNGYLKIFIQDNGIGLKAEKTFGNGLHNIKKRIESLNGTVSFTSENGTKISLEVKL